MNIRHVRKKIKSVTNVKKITRAMQLVSAVKMKKYQQAAVEAVPYQRALEEMIEKISVSVESGKSPYLQTASSAADRTLAIVVTTNKGLCGGFNINLLRHLIREVDFKKTDFITVGRKGRDFLGRLSSTILADYSMEKEVDVSSAIFDQAFQNFIEGKYSRVVIFYNRFVSAVRFDPTHDTLLPLSKAKEDLIDNKAGSLYSVEPSPEIVLDALFRSYLEEKIRFIMLQNEAGEHSARMLAMKSATDNATELIFNLTLLRNKIRQQNITYELLDMVTAQQSV